MDKISHLLLSVTLTFPKLFKTIAYLHDYEIIAQRYDSSTKNAIMI